MTLWSAYVGGLGGLRVIGLNRLACLDVFTDGGGAVPLWVQCVACTLWGFLTETWPCLLLVVRDPFGDVSWTWVTCWYSSGTCRPASRFFVSWGIGTDACRTPV